jgi:hypothetical protein
VSSKEGMFSKEGGHDSREKKLCEFLAEIFFCCGRSYCTDPYDSVQLYEFGHENRCISGMIFEVDSRLL